MSETTHQNREPANPLDVDEERIEVPDIVPAFTRDGMVARALGERYRYRAGQAEMAQLVRQALIEGRTALIEAGTGSGKSFAYLIPVIASGAKAFVSTANKTLQTQLWEKDIPALQKVTGHPFTAALLKGRANYICHLKLQKAQQQLTLPGQEQTIADLAARIYEAEDGTISGDVDEMRLFGRLREAVTAGRRDCLGRECPLYDRCYYEWAKLRAERADIVVVNHALLAFNLIMPFLSPRPVIVVDEAHELEQYVVNALRLGMEYDTIPQFINDNVVMRHAPDKVRQGAILLNSDLFERLSHKPSERERRWAVPGEIEEGLALADRLNKIHKALLRAYPPVEGDDENDENDENEENARHQATIGWAAELADMVHALTEEPPADHARYCEERGGRSGPGSVSLYLEPIQVADFLQEALFEPVKRTICTGATLAVAGGFDYLRQQIGAPHERAIERVIDSPFDYPNQALLYTPNGLIPQYGEGEEAYALELGREIWRLIQASRGRAFVLCTSWRRMTGLYELISPHLEYACYCQGDGLARAELLELFQNDAGGAVLFATKSFWEGVDVPGEALSLVIIDKLPFKPHFDPVIQYRQQRIRDRGGNPFYEMTLPE
ncbi:MAG: helicase C-terminal domain-containing protein, partial [Chloroflexota bacterium]|nr:helicase C-terminal domain-containing protein [Chloroflexota bacterium]